MDKNTKIKIGYEDKEYYIKFHPGEISNYTEHVVISSIYKALEYFHRGKLNLSEENWKLKTALYLIFAQNPSYISFLKTNDIEVMDI